MQEISEFIRKVYNSTQTKRKHKKLINRPIFLLKMAVIYFFAAYVIFSFCVMNLNIFEWQLITKVWFVFTISFLLGLTYLNHKDDQIYVSKHKLETYMHLIYNTATLAERLKNTPEGSNLVDPFTDRMIVQISADNIIDFTIEHLK